MSRLVSYIVPVVFFAAAFWISDLPKVFQYGPDEGIALMTALLYSKGHLLYKEIWLDQPPFFVLLLSSFFKFFSPSVVLARSIVLALSSLLLWALFRMISKTQNIWAAGFTVCTLIFSSYYVFFSVSVMRGLPALALAVLSCHCLWVYQTNDKKRYLALSALFFALAFLTKLFVVYFLPGLAIQLLFGHKKEGEFFSRRLIEAACWMGIFTAVCFWGFCIATSVDLSQLITPHILMREKAHVLFPGFHLLRSWFGEEYDILLVILGGFWATTSQERKGLLIPSLCFISGVLLVGMHYPVWSSYRMVIFIPMCWLASAGVYKITRRETWAKLQEDIKGHKANIREISALIFLFFAVAFSVVEIPLVKLPRLMAQLNAGVEPVTDYQKLIDLLKQYDGQIPPEDSHMVLTDIPIIPFYANLEASPYFTTSSITRVNTKLLTTKDFMHAVYSEHPSMVLLGRHTKSRGFNRFQNRLISRISPKYVLEYRDPNLYVLKSVADIASLK